MSTHEPGRPPRIPPRDGDLGAVQAYASSARTLIESGRRALEAGNMAEVSNLLDAAELQIDAMIESMPRQGRLG